MHEAHNLKLSTLPRYLIGSRSAILEVASSRWSILIGILFVLSAGLAREYDGEDLLHEPWHALRPLAASLASGTILFALVHGLVASKSTRPAESRPSLLTSYRIFMGLFWMTAPMAWLYAIPYERMLSPVDAVTVNLWTLALVAAWRVVLMVRVINVLYGVHAVAAFFIVMAFGDFVLFVAMQMAPTSLVNVMGGLQMPERDALVVEITTGLLLLSVMTAPIWLLGALVAAVNIKPSWPPLSGSPSSGVRGQSVPRGALALAILSIVAFIPALIVAQPEQINRRVAERLLHAGEIDEALAMMSERSASVFPPHWDPPPRVAYKEYIPDLDDVRAAMEANWPAEWVSEIYILKIRDRLQSELARWRGAENLSDAVEWAADYGRLQDLPEESRATAQFLLTHGRMLPAADRAALERLLRVLEFLEAELAAEPDREPTAPAVDGAQ